MAIRNTTHITKNSDIVNRPLPSSLLAGEAIVNTADGIVWYSGVTTSTDEWTPAGTGTTANFFEVGSNLYNLRLRNRITQYEDINGAGLVGKFLSGTTNGFVLANVSSISGVDSYLTGGTYNNLTNTITLRLNQGKPNVSITGITDAYVTGFTFTNNTLTIRQNEGLSNLSVLINSLTGLTVSNLTAGRVVYAGTGGLLTDEAGFEYNAGTNTLTAGNINTSASGNAFVGTGGLTVGSGGSVGTPGTGDVTIHGNLTIFGNAITASTGQLYVEDNNIILNYNPTGDTTSSSIGAGFTIQDGNGVLNGDVTLDIRAMNGFTGLTGSQIPDISEYSGPTGFANRGWVTQLHDIVIRSTNTTTPNGVRLLAEFDTLDGGSY